jgi:signal peptidase
MWQGIKKFISGLTTSVLFVLLIVTVFAVMVNQAADGEPNVFGYELKTVLSGSMEPEFQTGSIIAVEPMDDTTQFQKGDIITFYSPEELMVTHRIEEVRDNGSQYVTKGDNNNAADFEPVLAENVVGQYTGFTVPYAGYAVDFATSPEGALFLLIVPGAVLAGCAILIILRVLRQMEIPNEKEPDSQ